MEGLVKEGVTETIYKNIIVLIDHVYIFYVF